jgi:hypothetical protein
MNEHWPKPVEDGLIPTDNAMGIMTEEPSKNRVRVGA